MAAVVIGPLEANRVDQGGTAQVTLSSTNLTDAFIFQVSRAGTLAINLTTGANALTNLALLRSCLFTSGPSANTSPANAYAVLASGSNINVFYPPYSGTAVTYTPVATPATIKEASANIYQMGSATTSFLELSIDAGYEYKLQATAGTNTTTLACSCSFTGKSYNF